jgi:chromosome segregation ATPase
MAEDALKENIKKLSEIDTEIEELGRTERIFEKISDLEVAIQKITDLGKSAVRDTEMREVKKEIASVRDLINTLEKKMENSESNIRDQISRLSQVDAGIIKDLSEFGKVFAKINDVSTNVEKIMNAGYVDEKRLDDALSAIEEKVESSIKRADAKSVAQDLAIKRLLDVLGTQPKREELERVKEEVVNLKTIAESLGKKIDAYGGILKESISRLSEVDGKIIDDFSRVEKIIDKINELDREIRKNAEISRTFASERALSERAAAIEEKIDVLAKGMEKTNLSLASDIKNIKSEGYAKKEELDKIKEELKELNVLKDVRVMLEKRAAADEGIKRDVERLSRVDAEIIKELGKLSRVYSKINDHEVALRKLAELNENFVRRDEVKEMFHAEPEKIKKLKEEVRDLLATKQIAENRKSQAQLIEEKEEILQMLDALKEDYEKKLITKESYEETLRGSIKRLSDIDAELESGTSDKTLEQLAQELENLNGK